MAMASSGFSGSCDAIMMACRLRQLSDFTRIKTPLIATFYKPYIERTENSRASRDRRQVLRWDISTALSIAAVALASTYPAAATDGPECFSPLTRFNVCESARKQQADAARFLPIPINDRARVIGVTAIGPRVVFSVEWRISGDDLSQALREGQTTRNDIAAHARRLADTGVCNQRAAAAFVRLGGQIEYAYKTTDGRNIVAVLVDSCPARQ